MKAPAIRPSTREINATFRIWQETELVWLPDRGMGYYPVTEQPYDRAYFEKYRRYRHTTIGRRLNADRVFLANTYAGHDAEVVDVGIGDGAFIEERGRGTYGFDINPVAVTWLQHRQIFVDPYERQVDTLTFWDSIEHIHNPAPLLANAQRWVFASLPIVPGDGPPPRDWKHFRPDEHCWYWTRKGFVSWMAAHGFELHAYSTAEVSAGREDIGMFAFRRAAGVQ